jgi:hypothetical protein
MDINSLPSYPEVSDDEWSDPGPEVDRHCWEFALEVILLPSLVGGMVFIHLVICLLTRIPLIGFID